MEKKSPDAFRTISEVAEWLGVPTHVLRFWESRFSQVKPVKRAGGRRYYRPNDMALLGGIRKLLHEDGMTIRGVQKLLREEGVKHVAAMSPPLDSDEMRDITPSNVVPLASKSSAEENATASDGDAAAQEDIETSPREEDPVSPSPTSDEQPEMRLDEKAPYAPLAGDDAITADAAQSGEEAQAPLFTRAEVETPAETVEGEEQAPGTPPDLAAEHDTGADSKAEVTPTESPAFTDTPEFPGLTATSDSAPESSDIPAAPLIDISHVADDPGDGDATPRPALASAVRRVRKSGTSVHISTLQVLADRLESLAAQMGGTSGPKL